MLIKRRNEYEEIVWSFRTYLLQVGHSTLGSDWKVRVPKWVLSILNLLDERNERVNVVENIQIQRPF